MNDKKSFILHIDSLSILDELTMEQKGVLFDAIYNYQKGNEVSLDFAMRMAFLPFKNQFARDDEKYNTFREKQAGNGKKGGRKPKKPKPLDANPKNPSLLSETQKSLNVSVSVSDSVSVNTNSNEFDLEKKKKEKKDSFKNWDEERFRDECRKFKPTYPDEMLRQFFMFWTESDPNGKMRFQLQQTWETGRRLATWQLKSKQIKSGHYANSKSEHGNNAGAINLRNFLTQVAGSDFAGT
jgi:hypothetical protein